MIWVIERHLIMMSRARYNRYIYLLNGPAHLRIHSGQEQSKYVGMSRLLAKPIVPDCGCSSSPFAALLLQLLFIDRSQAL